MPAPSSAGGAAPPVPPRRGPARDVDGLIRDLQRINLSQCMDQLTSDIHQLSSMERQLSSWRGLYVRCPDPEPDDLGTEPADKKSSSGYSTESASPPGSRNTSGDSTDGQGTEGHGMNGYVGHGVNGHVTNEHGADGYKGSCNELNGFESGRFSVNSFKPRGSAPNGGVVNGWKGGHVEPECGLSRAGSVRGTERVTGAIRRAVAATGHASGPHALLNGFSQGNGLGGGLGNGASEAPIRSNGSSVSVGPRPDLGSREPRSAGGGQWRDAVGLGSPARLRRAGLLQNSVAHSSEQRQLTPLLSSEQRQLTPLLSRAPFCPPAASTPTLSPKLPRSPKTLRFAASHELIPPDSPSRRQVAGGAPRPGILRSRAGSMERQDELSRPAPPGWRADSSSSSPSPGRGQRSADGSGGPGGGQDAPDSAERFSRVVSALSRLEAELSSAQRRPPARACGTAQFVRHPPRRQLSFTALPPPPQHPRLLSGSATDSEDSDSDFDDDSRWLPDAGAAARPLVEPPSEGDFELSRGARLPPPYSSQPPKRRRTQLSWLLSCGSRRRPPSPPSAYLPPPPSEPPAPSSGGAYGCNLCKARFAEHFQLVSHVHERHVRVQMRPKYSCGLCPARFYASKFLARHCAYHHNSMGDARTPQCLKADSAT